MAQTTIIALGTTALNSSQVDVAAGSAVTIGLFSSTSLSPTSVATISVKTPSANTQIGVITLNSPIIQLTGPVSVIVSRPEQLSSVGVFLNT